VRSFSGSGSSLWRVERAACFVPLCACAPHYTASPGSGRQPAGQARRKGKFTQHLHAQAGGRPRLRPHRPTRLEALPARKRLSERLQVAEECPCGCSRPVCGSDDALADHVQQEEARGPRTPSASIVSASVASSIHPATMSNPAEVKEASPSHSDSAATPSASGSSSGVGGVSYAAIAGHNSAPSPQCAVIHAKEEEEQQYDEHGGYDLDQNDPDGTWSSATKGKNGHRRERVRGKGQNGGGGRGVHRPAGHVQDAAKEEDIAQEGAAEGQAEEEANEGEEVRYVEAPLPKVNPWKQRTKTPEEAVAVVPTAIMGEDDPPLSAAAATSKKPAQIVKETPKPAAKPPDTIKEDEIDQGQKENEVDSTPVATSEWPSLGATAPASTSAAKPASANSNRASPAGEADSYVDNVKENKIGKKNPHEGATTGASKSGANSNNKKRKDKKEKWVPVEIPFTPTKRREDGPAGGKGRGGPDREGGRAPGKKEARASTAETSKNWREDSRDHSRSRHKGGKGILTISGNRGGGNGLRGGANGYGGRSGGGGRNAGGGGRRGGSRGGKNHAEDPLAWTFTLPNYSGFSAGDQQPTFVTPVFETDYFYGDVNLGAPLQQVAPAAATLDAQQTTSAASDDAVLEEAVKKQM